MYEAGSVKTMEQKIHGCGDKIILKGESTERPADWKAFLSNSFAKKLEGGNVVLVCEGKAFKLTSADDKKTEREEILSLLSTQEETYSRIVLYSKYGHDKGYKYICVGSPDTDIFLSF